MQILLTARFLLSLSPLWSTSSSICLRKWWLLFYSLELRELPNVGASWSVSGALDLDVLASTPTPTPTLLFRHPGFLRRLAIFLIWTQRSCQQVPVSLGFPKLICSSSQAGMEWWLLLQKLYWSHSFSFSPCFSETHPLTLMSYGLNVCLPLPIHMLKL